MSIKDVVEATVSALQSDEAGGLFNVATGKEASVNSLLETMLRITGKRLTPIYGPPRLGEIRRSVADISKAGLQLNFTPRTDLERDIHHLWNGRQESNLDK